MALCRDFVNRNGALRRRTQAHRRPRGGSCVSERNVMLPRQRMARLSLSPSDQRSNIHDAFACWRTDRQVTSRSRRPGANRRGLALRFSMLPSGLHQRYRARLILNSIATRSVCLRRDVELLGRRAPRGAQVATATEPYKSIRLAPRDAVEEAGESTSTLSRFDTPQGLHVFAARRSANQLPLVPGQEISAANIAL